MNWMPYWTFARTLCNGTSQHQPITSTPSAISWACNLHYTHLVNNWIVVQTTSRSSLIKSINIAKDKGIKIRNTQIFRQSSSPSQDILSFIFIIYRYNKNYDKRNIITSARIRQQRYIIEGDYYPTSSVRPYKNKKLRANGNKFWQDARFYTAI